MTTLKQIEEKAMHAVRYGEDLRPVRDWLVLLALAGTIFVGSVLVNVWTFVRVIEGKPVGLDAAESSKDADAIQAAKKLFEERRAEEGRYKSEYQFVDPS